MFVLLQLNFTFIAVVQAALGPNLLLVLSHCWLVQKEIKMRRLASTALCRKLLLKCYVYVWYEFF